MPLPVYATEQEYKDVTGNTTSPDNIEDMLESGSRRVRRLTKTAIYHVDDDGFPTDPVLREAFMKATVYQADYLAETGDASGAMAALNDRSMSLGPFSIGGEATTGGGRSASEAIPTAPRTREVLEDHGLLHRAPRGY